MSLIYDVRLQTPEWGGAVLVLVMLIALVWALDRKGREVRTIEFSDIEIAEEVADDNDKLRYRVAIPLLGLIAFLLGAFAIASPATTTTVSNEQVYVCGILDVSPSMGSPDVYPSREIGMKEGMKEAVSKAPENAQMCIVSFAGVDDVNVVMEASLNRDETRRRIDGIELANGTYIAGGIDTAIGEIESLEDVPLRSAEELADGALSPVVFILLSDGSQSEGARSPLEAAQAAADRGISIHTVAFGTDEGTFLLNERVIEGKPDRKTLKAIAELTPGGEFHEAVSASELEEIFTSVLAQAGTETAYEGFGYMVGFVAAVFGAMAAMLFLRWHKRINN